MFVATCFVAGNTLINAFHDNIYRSLYLTYHQPYVFDNQIMVHHHLKQISICIISNLNGCRSIIDLNIIPE